MATRASASCRALTGAALLVLCLGGGVAAVLVASRKPEEAGEPSERPAVGRAARELAPREAVAGHARRLSSMNRLSGTDGCARAGEYIEKELRGCGLEVRSQEFDVVVPVTKEIEFRAEGEEFRVHPLWPNWTRTCTTRGVLSGPLVYAAEGKLKGYRGLPMEGAWFSTGTGPVVLLEGDKGLDWYSAAMLGARALIFCESDATNRIEMENKVSFLPANIPRFYCDRETGARLRALAEKFQEERSRLLEIHARASPEEKEELEREIRALAARPAVELSCRVDWEKRRTRNILAVLEGTDPAQRELVLFQAYYDSVSTVPDLAPGAESSCGAATLLELASEFARRPPPRSVGFVFLSGHFESMLGAKQFFGVLRKTHAEWLELAGSLEEEVLGTSSLEGPSFFDRWQASVCILAFVAGVGLAFAWLFAGLRALAFGAVFCGVVTVVTLSWGLLIPREERPQGALQLPRLEEARLAAQGLKGRAPDTYSRVLVSLSEADGRISRVLAARKEYERVCEERAGEGRPGLARPAREEAEVLLFRAREACATLASYEDALVALRSAPAEAGEEVRAALRAIESLIARDMSSARKLPLYLDSLMSLRALEGLGADLPERSALVVSLDLSSKADTLAFLFKGSFVDQHEKNYETTLARCIAPIADISCAIADGLSPGTMVNCVVNPRGLHWTNYTGGTIATDNEMAMLAALPGCCLVSAHDARDLLDTPLDVFDALDRRRLTRQASFIVEWARRFVEDPRTSTALRTMVEEKLLSRERFRTISARTVEFDMSRGMGVADKPVPGALMACYHDPGYYMRQKYRKMIWGVREAEMRFGDERGAALFNGIPDFLARYWNDKPYTVEAYRFDPATGDIIMAPDRGAQGAKKFRPTVEARRENEFLTCVVFPCVDVSVFDTLDQRSYYMFTHVELFDAETDAEPFRYGYRVTGRVGYNKSYIEPCAVLFLEPDVRFKVLFGRGATGTKYSLINSLEPTKAAHGGVGYEATGSFVVAHTPFKMARDLWNLDEFRIRNLVEHGVTNRQVQRLHEGARLALEEAEEAIEAGRFDEGVMRSREAWAFEAQGYPRVRGTTSDILRGVLFYLFLVLPFAYFSERLIFGFGDINKQLLGFFGIFLFVFLVLALVHPAFGVTNSSPVVLLSFLSVALSLLVLGMIRSRFELELSRLQQRPGAGARADFSRLNAAKSAFILGINNMRRRKMRTGLTLLTLVALTFSVLSFTSMEPETQILEHQIVNLERARTTGEGELEPPIRLGERGFRETEGAVESTGRVRVRDWLAVEATLGEDAPASVELVDSDDDACVMEFRPGSGYAAYALSSRSGAFLRSFWGLVSILVGLGGVALFFQGVKVRPYGGAAFALALVLGLLHFMPKGSAAGGIAPAELDPLGKDAHSWVLQFNPETRECMAFVDDKLVRRFRTAFLDPPLLVRARPRPASLSVQEERRGIPWKGFLIRQRGWGSMTSQTLRHTLDEFDPSEGHLVAPRAWWLLSQIEATATRITNAGEPSHNFLAQGLVGMTAEETEFTRPQEDLAAGRWFERGEEQVCVLPQKIARACGIEESDLDASPKVLILGEEMRVLGVTRDDLWSDKTDIDTEPISPVDYTVENWMKHSGAQRSELEFYHYTHLSPLNVAYVPYSFLISRGGTLRSIAVKPKGGMTKDLKKHLLEKLSLPLFIAGETKVVYASSTGARPIRGVGGLLVPMLICALIVLNTMLSAVYEREREIWIYGSLGLAPVHIGSLFMAESLVFAVMGTVIGYVLGQVVARFVAMGLFFEGLSLNYSSSSAVFSAVFVMAVVLLSSLYPAKRASSLSVPDIERIWKFPLPEGDLLRIDFPFTMSEQQAFGVSMHLKKFFEDHADQSVGDFYTSGARLTAREGGGVNVECRAWIAPFDFGISQDVTLETYPGDEPGIYEARMLLARLSGEPASWERMNHRFLGNIRKQFLIWRLFSAKERTYYLEEAKKELAGG